MTTFGPFSRNLISVLKFPRSNSSGSSYCLYADIGSTKEVEIEFYRTGPADDSKKTETDETVYVTLRGKLYTQKVKVIYYEKYFKIKIYVRF